MQIALQLYSVREDCERDLESTLSAVAEQGYAAVEPWNLHGRSAEEWRSLLDARGLATCGWHVPLSTLEEDAAGIADAARTLSLGRVVVPSATWPDTLAGVDEVVERVAAVARRLAGEGIAVGFHNHGAELEPRDGETPLDRLAAKDGLFLELDVGWAFRGGADPVELLRRHAGRCPLIHLKDEAGRQGPSTVVGEGVVGIPAVLRAAQEGGVEWLVVEQEDYDEPPLAAVGRCAANVRRLVDAL